MTPSGDPRDSQFEFIRAGWPDVFDAAVRAESAARSDPRTSCFYARRALELAVVWIYKHDPSTSLPYQESLSALIHDPTFKNTVGPALFAKARLIKDLGNLAAHSPKPLQEKDSLRATEDLFHFLFWLARTYSRGSAPPDSLVFDVSILPTEGVSAKSVAQIQKLESDLSARDEKLFELIADRRHIDAELQRLRDEIAAIRAANSARPDEHDYSEEATREYFIDKLLKEAGWSLSGPDDLEFEVHGMPSKSGTNDGVGYVDYVLWGDDGKPLGLVEAKRTRKDPRIGQRRRSSMPTVSRSDSVSGRSSSIRTVMTTGSGTTRSIHRGRGKGSTRRTSWSCSFSGARPAARLRPPKSTRRSSSVITRLVRSGI